MRRADTLATLRSRADDIRRLGVKSLALFGSVSRDEAREGSDVDLLVDFDGPATFDRYMDLKFFLEDLLGCRVDLITRKGLRPRLRPTVEHEAIHVA
ncbi:MAG: nucleotidyltransferase family protein [Myxococcota bacterium]